VKKSDILRNNVITKMLSEGVTKSDNISFINENNREYYVEVLPINSIRGNVSEYISDLIDNDIDIILEENGYDVDYNNLFLESSDLYDGYQLKVPIKKNKRDIEEDLFKELDEELATPQQNPQPAPTQQTNPGNVNPAVKNMASNVPLGKEPQKQQLQNLPKLNANKPKKTQNPKKVDLVLKTTFDTKFLKYTLRTDAENWKPVKKPEPNGKLFIVWENKDGTNLKIETLLFPNDTNKIEIFVKKDNKVILTTFFEIYRIPTNEFIAEKFFRKTFFNLLKKYIDTKVILLEPFEFKFVFWRSDNPTYAYSFSSPNKNKIILDLISFINTAQKPILDDFFEQNNLKHKQGYLQTLLDSAEAAGIFRFKCEGNEILILRGPNYKSFLDGKVRRVVS